MKTKMKSTNRLFSVLFIVLLFTACSKDGDDGAIGPQGPQGEQGPAGAQGEAGENGETGTANVIYSDWFSGGFDADITATSATATVDAPSITDAIRENGAILVYGRSTSGNIYGLPVTFGLGFQETYFYRTPEAGTLTIRIHSLDGNDVGDPVLGEFRYVLIPGGTTAAKSATLEDYSKMTYEEVALLFNIKD